jgi:Mo-dependent nitrogenase C-terminus
MNITTLSKLIFDLIPVIRQFLDAIEICNPRIAHLVCKIIPSQCPFERQLRLFDRTIFSIPPLCKLNPFYDQLIELRFKSLIYLAEKCHEDISLYC